MRHVGYALLAALILAAGLATAGLRPALGQQADHRVTICHKVNGNGNTGNGYDLITVDKDAIVNKDGQIVPNGHGTHEGDSIPPFDAGSQGQHEWGAFPGQGNSAIIDNNCAPVETTTTSTTTTTTTTTTGTTTTTPPPPPPTTTETTTTTTTSPPPTQPTTTTETTTEQETTTSPPETTPPPKKPKPPPKKPTPSKPKPPPACPPGQNYDGKCGVQGNG